ncbi:MAG: hypothetical protein K2O18_05635 [Oscillospiraceae bacterium]|nr:hypothetical protein [Oscillospiraceae bacterium]
MREQNRIQSRRMALCGVMAALSVVILSVGSIIPAATVAGPMMAMICLVPVHCNCGPKTTLLVYAAVSILAVLLCTDKELALFYVFFGWYPALRTRLLALPKALQIVVKCAIYSLMMTAMYAMLIFLFQMQAVVEEFSEYSTVMLAVLLAVGNVTFLLQDFALRQVTALYQRRRRR